jgi:hypothetical protein
MNKRLWATALFLIVIAAAVGVVVVPNPLGEKILDEARYRGYVAYTPDEAVTLAYTRCSSCHSIDKTLKFCATCGPPFIIVSHSMKKYIEVMNKNGADYKQFSDAELVAIVQVWNALVGNWEYDWRQKDIVKMLQGDVALIELAKTPLEQRPIEMVLKGKTAPGAYREIYSDSINKSGKQ